MKKVKSTIKEDSNRFVESGKGITVLKPAKPESAAKKTVKRKK